MARDYGNGVCPVCGVTFRKTTPTKVFCSEACLKLKKKNPDFVPESLGSSKDGEAITLEDVESAFTTFSALTRRMLTEQTRKDDKISMLEKVIGDKDAKILEMRKERDKLNSELRAIRKELNQFRQFILKNAEVEETKEEDTSHVEEDVPCEIPPVQRDITELENVKKKRQE